MSSVTIRQATSFDKEAVLCIRTDVYDGLDYLAEYFDDFIACPLTTPYVAVVDNKIVGFVAAFVIDDGKTVVTRAGRVSQTVSGQGLYKQMDGYVLRASGVSRHAFLTVNTNPSNNKDSFRSVNKFVLMKPFFRFLFDAHSLRALADKAGSLHTPTDEDLKWYFTSSEIRHYLFPNERLIVDMVPFRLNEANIPLLRWSGKRVKGFSDVSVQDLGRVKGLLTFSTTYPAKRPAYCCLLNVYGTDTTTLEHHVLSHIRHIRDMADGSTSLVVSVEPDFDMQELEKTFRKLGLQKSEWRDSEQPDLIYSHQYMFEKEIKT